MLRRSIVLLRGDSSLMLQDRGLIGIHRLDELVGLLEEGFRVVVRG
jgi:hypothetical protein